MTNELTTAEQAQEIADSSDKGQWIYSYADLYRVQRLAQDYIKVLSDWAAQVESLRSEATHYREQRDQQKEQNELFVRRIAELETALKACMESLDDEMRNVHIAEKAFHLSYAALHPMPEPGT